MLKENVMKGCTFLVRLKLIYTFVYSTRILVVYFQFHILISFCMHLSLLYFDFFSFHIFIFVFLVWRMQIVTSKLIMTSYCIKYRQVLFYISLWEALTYPRVYIYMTPTETVRCVGREFFFLELMILNTKM